MSERLFVRASELYDDGSRTPIAHSAHQASDDDVERMLEERGIRVDSGKRLERNRSRETSEVSTAALALRPDSQQEDGPIGLDFGGEDGSTAGTSHSGLRPSLLVVHHTPPEAGLEHHPISKPRWIDTLPLEAGSLTRAGY